MGPHDVYPFDIELFEGQTAANSGMTGNGNAAAKAASKQNLKDISDSVNSKLIRENGAVELQTTSVDQVSIDKFKENGYYS